MAALPVLCALCNEVKHWELTVNPHICVVIQEGFFFVLLEVTERDNISKVIFEQSRVWMCQ